MMKATVAKVAGGVAVTGLVLWFIDRNAKKAGAAISQGAAYVGDGVNPASTGNFVYRGIGAVVDVLDDGSRNSSNTLGTAIHGGVEKVKGWFK